MGSDDYFSLSEQITRIGLSIGNLIGKGFIEDHVHTMSVVVMFPQTWANTNCGFGGIAGQAMTTAFTLVLQSMKTATFHVFINGHYAYSVSENCDTFKEDLRKFKLAGKTECGKYKKNPSTNGDK